MKWQPYFQDVLNLKKSWSHEVRDIARGKGKYPLLCFSIGKGERSIVIISRIHGHEPAGTSGLCAFLNYCNSPSIRNDVFFSQWSKKWKLHVFPMVNVDAAIRYQQAIPECFPPNRFSVDESSYRIYKNILTSPGLLLHDNLDLRVTRISKTDIAKLKKINSPLGTLYNENGIELFLDWKTRESVQIKALHQFIAVCRPEFLVDIHCHELPTNIFIPMVAGESTRLGALKCIASELIKELRKSNAPCTTKKRIRSYKQNVPVLYAQDYLFAEYGISSLLWEVNNGYKLPSSYNKYLGRDSKINALTKEQMTRTVYLLLSRFLQVV